MLRSVSWWLHSYLKSDPLSNYLWILEIFYLGSLSFKLRTIMLSISSSSQDLTFSIETLIQSTFTCELLQLFQIQSPSVHAISCFILVSMESIFSILSFQFYIYNVSKYWVKVFWKPKTMILELQYIIHLVECWCEHEWTRCCRTTFWRGFSPLELIWVRYSRSFFLSSIFYFSVIFIFIIFLLSSSTE